MLGIEVFVRMVWVAWLALGACEGDIAPRFSSGFTAATSATADTGARVLPGWSSCASLEGAFTPGGELSSRVREMRGLPDSVRVLSVEHTELVETEKTGPLRVRAELLTLQGPDLRSQESPPDDAWERLRMVGRVPGGDEVRLVTVGGVWQLRRIDPDGPDGWAVTLGPIGEVRVADHALTEEGGVILLLRRGGVGEVRRFATDGSVDWVVPFGGEAGGVEPHRLVVHPSERLTVAGEVAGGDRFVVGSLGFERSGLQGFAFQLEPDGSARWVTHIPGAGSNVRDVAPDGDEVILAGELFGVSQFAPGRASQMSVRPGASTELFLARFDASGELSWEHHTRQVAGALSMRRSPRVVSLGDGRVAWVGHYFGWVFLGDGQLDYRTSVDTVFVAVVAADTGHVTCGFPLLSAGDPVERWPLGVGGLVALPGDRLSIAGHVLGGATVAPGSPAQTLVPQSSMWDVWEVTVRLSGE